MIRDRDKLVLPLIDRVYAAALDKAKWQDFLAALGEVLGAPGTIFSQDTRSAAASIFDEVGFAPGAILEYVGHYADKNPWLPSFDRQNIPAGVTIVDEDLIETRAYEASEFYNDWVKPQNLYYVIGARVLKERSIGTNLSYLRSRAAGPFRDDEKELFSILAPHVARAAQVHRHLFAIDLARGASELALDGLDVGLLIVDRDARICFANRPAERILKQATGLRCGDGRLQAASPRDRDMLRGAISRAVDTAAGKDIDAGGLLPIRRNDAEPLLALVSPLPPDKSGLGTVTPAALVLVGDPAARVRSRDDDLMRLYGLTHAEAMLLVALVDGERLTDFAGRKGISLPTAKTQLQRVFDKTGQNRQSELIRLVLSNPLVRIRV